MKFISKSANQTREFAKKLAKDFKGTGGIIALIGDLGAGKTTFTQGFAEGLEIKDKIISPTFVLIRQHKIPNSKKTLYHLDLYRLEENFDDIGLIDLLNSDDLVLIEWAEKIDEKLPKGSVKIKFEKIEEEKRQITKEKA